MTFALARPHLFSPSFAHTRRNPLRGVRQGFSHGSTLPPRAPTNPADPADLARSSILGRWQAGRGAAQTVPNPAVGRSPNRLLALHEVLPVGVGVHVMPTPTSRGAGCSGRPQSRGSIGVSGQ